MFQFCPNTMPLRARAALFYSNNFYFSVGKIIVTNSNKLSMSINIFKEIFYRREQFWNARGIVHL